ncbi:MAG: type II toxin-antitoxin system VapC family toxin [Chromatiales bacterium]|jgi:predicted nucleic acid-binding protein|nr:type II toxin-antitoxin system VapC family toxin [Chromatiales bacterium]
MVLDASAAIELLLNTPLARTIAGHISDESISLDAPHLIDVEITQAPRRYVNLGNISQEQRFKALGHWRDLNVERHPHEPYLTRVWQLRNNFSADDATYVVLAEVLGSPLLTADAKLAGAPGSNAHINHVSLDMRQSS